MAAVQVKGMKTVLLTGVTRGLGRALAAELDGLGHRVAGCGRDATALADLRRRFDRRHRFDPVDVACDGAVGDWAKDVLATHGVPDLLVNNAAVINGNAPLWKVSEAEFSRVIDINVKGVANVIRHFVPAMIRAKAGIIVNFSSGWGRSSDAEVGPYCASKWAIEGLTRSLALELPDGMAAVPLNPGIINTDMLRSCFGPAAESYATAPEWARRAVPFLLGLSGRHNGQPLTVPGG